MANESRTFAIAAVALVFIFLIATTLFTFFENRERPEDQRLTYFQVVYWGIVTLSTVGYGDITPVSDAGKAISMFFILFGLSIYVFVIGGIASLIIDKGLKESKGLKKCSYKGHVVILGMNDVVEEAIRQLVHGRRQVAVVVETGEDVDRANRLDAYPVLGDPTQPESLENANLASADTVLINLQDDSKTIIAALACRKVNRSVRIVASIRERQLIELIRESGVESVVSPQSFTGRMLASSVFEPDVIDFVDDVTSGLEGADLREFKVSGSPIAGGKVGDALINLRRETGTVLVGLVKAKEGGKEITNPDDDLQIDPEDKVILLGYEDQFQKAMRFLKGR